MSVWGELKRRNVVKVAATYAIVAWLVVQIASVFAPALGMPDWVLGFIVFVVILGFPIALVLAWAYELTPQGVMRTEQVSPEDSVAHVTGRKLNYLLSALLAVALAVVVLDVYVFDEGGLFSSAADDPEARTAGSEERTTPSIAVLPFIDLSPEGNQEYFSDGLSEELLNRLAQIDSLRVAGRTSSFAFKGQNADLRGIGESLGVEHLLEGSVRRIGDELRITAQLVSATDGFHLWSETYARELDDVFAVQEEIAAEVAAALSLELGIGGQTVRYGGTESYQAYDLYLRGAQIRDADPARAIEILEQAVAIDPDYASAWSVMSIAYGRVLNAATSAEAAQRALDEMERTARRALAAAPDSWEGHNALVWPNLAKRDFLAAETAMASARARSGARGGVFANGSNANFLHQIGRVEEALEERLVARRSDPLNGLQSFGVQLDLLLLGRYEEALAEYERNADLPRNGNAMEVINVPWLIERGDVEAVEQRFSRGSDIFRRVGELLDAPDRALEVMRQIMDDPGYKLRDEQAQLAILAAYYGDPSLAVGFLRNAYFAYGFAGFFLMWHPELSSARQTDDFKQFARDLGLVELWRETGEWGDYCHPVSDTDFECS